MATTRNLGLALIRRQSRKAKRQNATIGCGWRRSVMHSGKEKKKHPLLWDCVQQMKEIRKNYNKILRAKYLRIGKHLRKLPEISELFEKA